MYSYLHNSDQLSRIQINPIHLCNEDGSHCDKKCCSVHVDCGPDGQNKLGDPGVHVVVLVHAAEGDGQSCSSVTIN